MQASEDFFDLDGEDAADLDGALEPLEEEPTENGGSAAAAGIGELQRVSRSVRSLMVLKTSQGDSKRS